MWLAFLLVFLASFSASANAGTLSNRLKSDGTETQPAVVKQEDSQNFVPIKGEEKGKKDPDDRPTLAHNSPFYYHAAHQNYDVNTRSSLNIYKYFSKQPSNSSRDAQALTGCGADILCDASTLIYRTFDGSCNNLNHPSWGRSNTPYKRLAHHKFSIINCGNPSVIPLPNPRLTSRLLVKRGENDVSSTLTMFVMTFGQVIDHDLQLTPVRQTPTGEFLDCCAPINKEDPDCCPIEIPVNDHFYRQDLNRPNCLPFLRSKKIQPTGQDCLKLPDVENANTAWIDMSFVYGSEDSRALELRSPEGGGKMKTSPDSLRGRHFPFISVTNNVPRMNFGDTRGDVHPGFTVLTTVFLRNHNLIADQLRRIQPSWTDEKLYQEARKINIAIFQNIVYTQFLNALLGDMNDVSVREQELHRDFYDPQVDGSIKLVFSTAAFRLHTFVSGAFQLKDRNFQLVKSLRLRDVFHAPMTVLEDNNFDDLIRGHATQSLHEFNNVYTEEMTEWLFADFNNHDWGLDIVALNVQRGRDHQIQGYTTYKQLCGLGTTLKWSDMEDLIPEELVHRMLHTYQSPDDVDLYIGGSMEMPLKGSQLGPTMHCLVRAQFDNLKKGDRFFYTNPSQFTAAQLASIKRTSLASVLCDNSDDPANLRLPRNVFKIADNFRNPLIPCSQHEKLNVNAWR